MTVHLIIAAVIVILTIVALIKRYETRMVLIAYGFAMGLL